MVNFDIDQIKDACPFACAAASIEVRLDGIAIIWRWKLDTFEMLGEFKRIFTYQELYSLRLSSVDILAECTDMMESTKTDGGNGLPKP